MSRWIQHGCALIAAATVTLAGASLSAQQGNAAATATVGVSAKPGTLEKAGAGADKALEKASEKLDEAAKKAEEAAAKAAEKADKAAEKADKAAEKVAEKLEEMGDKAAEKADKAAEKADKAAEKAGEKLDDAARATKKAERDVRAKTQREVLRAKVKGALNGQPMTEAMRQELKRHARRIARLERIKTVAQDAKDDASADRADKLIEKENARHDKFMATVNVKADVKTDVKAGAK